VDLLEILGRQILDFFEDIPEGAELFSPPAEGNDAVGAEIVAAFHNGHVGADGSIPHGQGTTDFFPVPGPTRPQTFSMDDAPQYCGQLHVMIGPDDEIDEGSPGEDFFLMDLGHTAGDSDDDVAFSLQRG